MTRRRRKNPFQFLTKFPKRMQKKLVMLFVAIILALLFLSEESRISMYSKVEKYTRIVLNNSSMEAGPFRINEEIS